ncbi:hypothetical protein EBB07_29185 [Paenibacillaceae bacterium]|nr:hypothetical protein EBB07_29185 [Paenibacillaceae bacterium]
MRKSLQSIKHMINLTKQYPGLPDELKSFYAYLSDCGHSIMAVPKSLAEQHSQSDLSEFEAAVPVKYVLANKYLIHDGYIIINVPYDEVFGIDVDDGYEEY